MKPTIGLLLALFSVVLPCNFTSTALASTNTPTHSLTFELRDGSRIVGSSVGESVRFRSALLGDLKLALTAIRSVDCFGTNAARITTAGGDVLSAQFVSAELSVKTAFGKVEVPVKSIRQMTVSEVGVSHKKTGRGLVAFWSAEGNALDGVGKNDGKLLNGVHLGTGAVGQAFHFEANNQGVRIPASRSLDVGVGDGFTIECWIKPDDRLDGPLLEWNDGRSSFGVHLWIGRWSGPGTLFANLVDQSGIPHSLLSDGGVVRPGEFQHVALNYNRRTGTAKLYWNSTEVAETRFESFTPSTAFDFYIGHRPAGTDVDSYSGEIDEVAVYDRVLSAEEIEASCKEANRGELPKPPPARKIMPRWKGRGYAT